MKWFPQLKTLFSCGKFCSENKSGDSENRKCGDVNGPANLGNHSMVAGVININMTMLDGELKNIQLTDFEKQVVEFLAEGAKIRYIYGEGAIISSPFLFGVDGVDVIDHDQLLQALPALNRKGLLDSEEGNLYVISAMGRRIIQALDERENNKVKEKNH